MKTCLTSIVMVLGAVVANAREPNYDESKVAPYTLEDPLAFADGRKLKDASEWPARLSGRFACLGVSRERGAAKRRFP